MKTTINTGGLILATLGSYIVWHFIGEINFADKEGYLKGDGRLVVPTATPEVIAKLKRQILLSRLGLGCIVLGGGLQVFSNYLPE